MSRSGAAKHAGYAVAVIPARGGSVGIPGKNLQTVGGKSLVGRAVNSCVRADTIHLVLVTTDNDDIAAAATEAGAQVVRRPPELATDTATSEAALLHALTSIEQYHPRPEIVVFVQCTSPFIAPQALDRAIARVAADDADVVFAAVETYEFLWQLDSAGFAVGANHDHTFRPRRQDREPHYRETGAFYAMRAEGFREAKYRFFGRIAVEPVEPITAVDIDHPYDLVLARAIATSLATDMSAS